MDKSKIKVCVGLSGGVDSSVAAWLLKQEGYDVFAMFMQNWDNADVTLHGDCEWEEDRFVAEMVARKIGIPFYYVNLASQYRQRVVDYMFDEYSKGRTPNPDVLCNREIKFEAFLQVAQKYGAQYVATGHYCRKEILSCAQGDVYRILEGTDPNKDQTYFLCQLSQEQLSKAMFPIGHLTKPEVRRIAKEADLPSAEKKDSQGICFVGKVDLPTFLKQKLESVEGDIVEVFDAYYADDPLYQWQQQTLTNLLQPGQELERTVRYAPEEKILTSDGAPLGESPYKEIGLTDEELAKLAAPITYNIVFETETYRSGKKHIKKTRYKANPYGVIAGRHEGAQFYTIGQRKGLGVGGHQDPVFVIATDTEANRVYVGEGHNHKGLSRFCLRVAPEEIHWIRPDLKMAPGENRRFRVRIRYRQPLQSATLIMRESGLYILFDQPQRGISPGQFAVWYNGEEMVGSGVIFAW